MNYYLFTLTIDKLIFSGGGVLKLVRIKSLKKKITFLVYGFIIVVVADVKIVQTKQIL